MRVRLRMRANLLRLVAGEAGAVVVPVVPGEGNYCHRPGEGGPDGDADGDDHGDNDGDSEYHIWQ